MGYTYIESCLLYCVNLGTEENFENFTRKMSQLNKNVIKDKYENEVEFMNRLLSINNFGDLKILEYGYGKPDGYVLYYKKSVITGGLIWEDEEINVDNMQQIKNKIDHQFRNCMKYLDMEDIPAWKNIIRIF